MSVEASPFFIVALHHERHDMRFRDGVATRDSRISSETLCGTVDSSIPNPRWAVHGENRATELGGPDHGLRDVPHASGDLQACPILLRGDVGGHDPNLWVRVQRNGERILPR